MSHYAGSPMGIFEDYGEVFEMDQELPDPDFSWYYAGSTFSGNARAAEDEFERLVELHSPKDINSAYVDFLAGLYKE